MGVLLFIIAVILLWVLSLPLIIYSMIKFRSFKTAEKYFFCIAQSIDQMGNALGQYAFNDMFIKKGGHEFGDIDETISSVIGINYINGTLTQFGKSFRAFLDFVFGKGHCQNSIGSKMNTQK